MAQIEKSAEIRHLDPAKHQKQQAALLLAQGMPPAQVAKEVGCHKNTLLRWNQDDDEFIDLLDEMEGGIRQGLISEAVSHSRDEIRARVVRSAEIIDEALHSDDEKIRVQVATQVLKAAGALSEQVNVTVGLEQMIEHLDGSTTGD